MKKYTTSLFITPPSPSSGGPLPCPSPTRGGRDKGWGAPKRGTEGAALITALLFLVIITALGMAAMWTSTTETMIAANQYKAKQALYMADAGVQDALSQLDNNNIVPPAAYDANWEAVIPAVAINGNTYTVTVKFKVEEGQNVDGDGVVGGEKVLYNKGSGVDGLFNFENSYISTPGEGGAVYTVTSVGTVPGATGATATIVADITENLLNVDSPGGFFSGGCVTWNTGPAATHIEGGSKPGVVTSDACTECLGASCPTVAGTTGAVPQQDATVVLDTYMGVPLSEIQNYVTSPQPAADISIPSRTYTFSAAQPAGAFGDQATNDPAIIYIDLSNPDINPNLAMDFTVNANGLTGYGILVIKGNLRLSGGFNWLGLVIVDNWTSDPNALNTGTVEVVGGGGGNNITGGLMASGDSSVVSGSIDVTYNSAVLEDIAEQAFKYKIINWRQVFN